MDWSRRVWIASVAAGLLGALKARRAPADPPDGPPPEPSPGAPPPKGLAITALRVTPIALPDPPILAASGCHGPYFLRNVVELETEAGVAGIGETHGGEAVTAAIEACRPLIAGRSAFAYGAFAGEASRRGLAAYAGIELACLDAIGRATGRRVCEVLTLASDTHYPWLVEGADVISGANLAFKDGKMEVPSGPGLGVELDRDQLKRAHEVYLKCGMRRRDDAHTMRLVEPGWRRTPY